VAIGKVILNAKRGKMIGTNQHRNHGSRTRGTKMAKVAKEAKVAKATMAVAMVVLMECVAETKVQEHSTNFRRQENAVLARIASANMSLPRV
jgi:hypothetical protein